MELKQLVEHPEMMNKETLYDLRSLLALHPYYQPARLLMLQNLYLLHDPTFDEELRRAAIYITDRRVIFNLVEAAHYQIKPTAKEKKQPKESNSQEENRTISLIDNFLDSIPEESEEHPKKRKPTPADAAVDYVAYLLEVEKEETPSDEELPQMKGQNLIDDFINKEGGKIQLKDEPEFLPAVDDDSKDDDENADESYFTETLAKIYIKQGRYSRALEIIQRLNLNYPKKNAYFADQIRFLEKLIRNSQAK